jgi:hypothetical protein
MYSVYKLTKENQMEWKKDTARYANGEVLFLGAWNVGGVHYDSLGSNTDKLKYIGTCKLPGIKGRLGNFETKKEAKAVVEAAVEHWMSKLPQQQNGYEMEASTTPA